MIDFEAQLDQLLDLWKVQPLGRDLAGPIMDRARREEAALDELLAAVAVPQLTRDLAADILAGATHEDAQLDRAFVAGPPVPAMSGDLSGTIMGRIRRESSRRRAVRWAAPLAAAAALAIVGVVQLMPHGAGIVSPTDSGQGTAQTTSEAHVAVSGNATSEQLIRQMRALDKDPDLLVYVHWDDIQAMERLEQQSPTRDRL
ncbi:MAG: hypothetical protein BIFFINMI_02480 [Phycisphaerae bacterium]|nr:hypothetical protein [Phycisphaerae bacterium]